MERRVTLLSEGWRFALGDSRPAEEELAPVHIPHDWAIGRKISQDAPLDMSQGWFCRGDIGWYRLELELEAPKAERRYFLDFGGVFECAQVYVNGQNVGGQRYGYTPFRLEITEMVQAGLNTVWVRVDNTGEPADRWYSGCGIYRPVYLLETDLNPLDERKVCVRTDISSALAEIFVETGMHEQVTAVIETPEGTVIKAQGRERIQISIPSPRLWSAETPVLYPLTLQLDGGDSITLKIGLRSIQIDAEHGLKVNGQRTILRGVCLHQDMGCRGIAATKEMWRDRLVILKKMGCNALRLAHHMHSAEMMDLCDEMGFYVYEECFDKWHSGLYGRYFNEDWQNDLSAMILRDRNRPSVIIWGVGNEVENQGQQSMVNTLAMLTDYARSLDPARPVTYAMNPHFKKAGRPIDFSEVRDIQKLVDEVDEREIEDLGERVECIAAIAEHVDILSGNYQEQWFDAIQERIPGKPILTTEAYPFFVGHRDSMQNYTQRIPALFPDRIHGVIGSFIWAGYDYLGESMGWPSKGWTGSLLRMDGKPRVAAYILESHWRSEPMVHISILDNSLGNEFTKAHWANPPFEDVWDFPDLHQGVVPYLIATNCEKVEIHSGGRVFYPPHPEENPDGYIMGFIPWMPGIVEARGFVDGQLAAVHKILTPGTPAALRISTLTERVPLPGEEIMVTAEIVDADDNPCIRDTRMISFAVVGDAEITGAGSADLMDPTPYCSNIVPAWHGRASAVIRRTGLGSVLIAAEANGLQRTELVWKAS